MNENNMKLFKLTLTQVKRLLRSREISSVELTKAILDRIYSTENKINSYITITPDLALKQAADADIKLSNGNCNGLTGIPVGIKDIICTKDIKTTCGSKMLENFISLFDATLITKLKNCNAVILGKHNMDEFAMGSSTENSFFGPTKNPWDISTVPGGSSGGSAASVAAGSCFYAIGTDTGGSIRQPASHCGVVGLKPTYGLVSRLGLVAFSSSLDQAGPIARTVADLAEVLTEIAGYDRFDSTSIRNNYNNKYIDSLNHGLNKVKIGLPKEYFNIDIIDKDVSDAIYNSIDILEKNGAEIINVSLPHTEYALPAYYIIATAEASSNLARYDGIRYGFLDTNHLDRLTNIYSNARRHFGNEVLRRIMLGGYTLSAGYYESYYNKANQVRTLIKQDFIDVFNKVDVLISPVTPTPAFKIGEKIEDPLQMYLSDIFTIPCNLAGLCGISVPCGFSKKGMPIGLQILGPYLGESKILSVGNAYQKITNNHLFHPNI